uniref:GINS complex subunit 4 n=1 Tax=Anopheles atroparvus TaxID=41427 RepID=A0AAG5D465_ANOAO
MSRIVLTNRLEFLVHNFLQYLPQVLQSLQRAWMNEKFAPDLLPYEDALVEMVMIQLVHMEENLASADKNNLLYIVHRMEVERIRFVVASYLRCRLQKIETYFCDNVQYPFYLFPN